MSQLHKEKFAIEGMSCSACKARIEKQVGKLTGVTSVSVHLLKNTMSVQFDEMLCSSEQIINCVTKAGYKAHLIHKYHAHGHDLNPNQVLTAQDVTSESLAIIEHQAGHTPYDSLHEDDSHLTHFINTGNIRALSEQKSFKEDLSILNQQAETNQKQTQTIKLDANQTTQQVLNQAPCYSNQATTLEAITLEATTHNETTPNAQSQLGQCSYKTNKTQSNTQVKTQVNQDSPSKVEVAPLQNEGLANQTAPQSNTDSSANAKDASSQTNSTEFTDYQEQKQSGLNFTLYKLATSFVLTLILMLIAMGHMIGLNFIESAQFNVYTQLALTIGVIALNLNYFKNGFRALLHFAPNMDSLVAIGATTAFVFSIYNMQAIPAHFISEHLMDTFTLYFESVASILTLVSVGKYLESKAKLKALDAIGQLYSLAPEQVTVRRKRQSAYGGSLYFEETISLDEVVIGDEVILRSGDRIGVDGVVIEGKGYIDESSLTGETNPIKKVAGSQVMSATFLSYGYLVYRVEKVGEDTTLAKIIELIDEANNQKAPIARIADVIAYYFVPTVILIALATLAIWLYIGAPLSHAISFAVSVLVVSCPCALGLATPTAIVVGTGRAAALGILFKTPEALESLHKVDIMVLDKTGTLTEGKMAVRHYVLAKSDYSPQYLARVVLALEKMNQHPIAKAIVTYLKTQNLMLYGTVEEAEKHQDKSALNHLSQDENNTNILSHHQEDVALKINHFFYHEGYGIEADIENETFFIGSSAFAEKTLYNNTHALPHDPVLHTYEKQGLVTVHLFTNKQLLLTIALGDELKDYAQDVASYLRALNIRPVIVSGDSLQVVEHVAEQVGISTYKANALPEDKSTFIRSLQGSGHIVGMMGDGINDAPSLSTSDVAISISGASDIASSCANVILMRNNLKSLIQAILLSKLTLKNIKENLFWAFIYNIICIPVAAGLFYLPLGLQLTPNLAALLMSLSSICVVTNALRLNHKRLKIQLDNGKTINLDPYTRLLKHKLSYINDIRKLKQDYITKMGKEQQNRSKQIGKSTDFSKKELANAKEHIAFKHNKLNKHEKALEQKHKQEASCLQLQTSKTQAESSVNEEQKAERASERAGERVSERVLARECEKTKELAQSNEFMQESSVKNTKLREQVSKDLHETSELSGNKVKSNLFEFKPIAHFALKRSNKSYLEQKESSYKASYAQSDKVVHGLSQDIETYTTDSANTKAHEQVIKSTSLSKEVRQPTSNIVQREVAGPLVEKMLWIEGMNCHHCVKRVQQALFKLDLVSSVQVDLAKGQAMVILSPELSDDTLKSVLAEDGYKLVGVVVTADVPIKKQIVLEGLNCQHCVQRVNKALTDLKGCDVLDIDLETQSVTVKAAIGLSDSLISTTIVKAGYKVVSINDIGVFSE